MLAWMPAQDCAHTDRLCWQNFVRNQAGEPVCGDKSAALGNVSY